MAAAELCHHPLTTQSKYFRDTFDPDDWLVHYVWNTDFADAMSFVLLLTWAYSSTCRACKWKLPWHLQYYTLMYALFAVLLFWLYFRIWGLMQETSYLDDATMETSQKADLESRGCNVTEARWEELLAQWSDECMMSREDINWIRNFTRFLPMVLLCTLFVCAYHTACQVRKIPKTKDDHFDCFSSAESVNRNKVILILALPFVYAFLSMWSVVKMWEVSANSMVLAQLYWGDVSHVRDALLLSYESTFGVADVYEAMALHKFAELMVNVIDGHAHHRREAKRLQKQVTSGFEEGLGHAQGKLVFVGIRYFCISCLLSAIQRYVPAQVYVFFGSTAQLKFMQSYAPHRDYISGFVTGIGYVTSFSAIENILVVEHIFSEREEIVQSGFHIGQKFLSAKILVSLVFFQQILLLLPPLNAMSETHKMLMHAGMLCLECLFISVFHGWAWRADHTWYNTPLGSLQEPFDTDGSSRSADDTWSGADGSSRRSLQEPLVDRD